MDQSAMTMEWTEELPKEPGWYVINEPIGAGKVGVYDVILHKSGELVYGSFSRVAGVMPGTVFLRIPDPKRMDEKFDFKRGDLIQFFSERYEVIENYGRFGVVRDGNGLVLPSFPWAYDGYECELVERAVKGDPYAEGATAYKLKITKDGNRYSKGSEDWHVWNSGWEVAKAEQS